MVERVKTWVKTVGIFIGPAADLYWTFLAFLIPYVSSERTLVQQEVGAAFSLSK